MNPLVSTLICTYNAKDFFGPTIRSVLDQTYENQEILIWDDCSTDGTEEMLQERAKKDNRIRLFIEPGVKKGPYGGLNYLLDNAKGKYIAIQDHDDIWHPEKLEKQVKFLEENEEYEGCGVQTLYWYDHSDDFIMHNKNPGIANTVQHTGLLYRKSDKRYDLTWNVGTDTYFMKRVLGRIYQLSFVGLLHRRRIDKGNLSTKWSRSITGRAKMRRYGLISSVSFVHYIYSGFFPRIQFFLSQKIFSRKRVVPKEAVQSMGFTVK